MCMWFVCVYDVCVCDICVVCDTCMLVCVHVCVPTGTRMPQYSSEGQKIYVYAGTYMPWCSSESQRMCVCGVQVHACHDAQRKVRIAGVGSLLLPWVLGS